MIVYCVGDFVPAFPVGGASRGYRCIRHPLVSRGAGLSRWLCSVDFAYTSTRLHGKTVC